MKRFACLFAIVFFSRSVAAQTVVQQLFNAILIGGVSAQIANTGQVGHQVYVQASNAPSTTCVAPAFSAQLEFSFDNVTWTAFGSPIAIPSFASNLSYNYVGSGTFNYMRFHVLNFDSIHCAITAWYTGSAQPIYFSNQGPVVSSTIVGTRGAGSAGLQFAINPTVNGGIATQSTISPMVLCDVNSQATVTAGTTGLVIISGGGTTGLNVCAVAVTMATTGTFQFVKGTGATCGTGTTAISPVFNLNAGVPFTLGNGTGTVMSNLSSGFGGNTGTVGGNICVVAVTGNVSVMATYAAY